MIYYAYCEYTNINDGTIELRYVKSADMIADMLTKPTYANQFCDLRDVLLNWKN